LLRQSLLPVDKQELLPRDDTLPVIASDKAEAASASEAGSNLDFKISRVYCDVYCRVNAAGINLVHLYPFQCVFAANIPGSVVVKTPGVFP